MVVLPQLRALALVFFVLLLHQTIGRDICQWEYGRSILVNETIFWMGGNYTFEGGARSTPSMSHFAQAHKVITDKEKSAAIILAQP